MNLVDKMPGYSKISKVRSGSSQSILQRATQKMVSIGLVL